LGRNVREIGAATGSACCASWHTIQSAPEQHARPGFESTLRTAEPGPELSPQTLPAVEVREETGDTSLARRLPRNQRLALNSITQSSYQSSHNSNTNCTRQAPLSPWWCQPAHAAASHQSIASTGAGTAAIVNIRMMVENGVGGVA